MKAWQSSLASFTLVVTRWLKTQRKIKLKSNIIQSKPKINSKIICVEGGAVEAGNVVVERVRIREGMDKKEYGRAYCWVLRFRVDHLAQLTDYTNSLSPKF